jgi:hypothetical protein
MRVDAPTIRRVSSEWQRRADGKEGANVSSRDGIRGISSSDDNMQYCETISFSTIQIN